MNFREELKSYRFTMIAITEDMLEDIFEKHVKSWHDGDAEGTIWQFLGVSLEEYSDIITKGDGMMEFFQKVCVENT